MEGWLWIQLAVMLGGLVIFFQHLWKKWFLQQDRVNWPPGPSKLPIIGNLHQLSTGGDLIHVKLAKLAQEHGGLMTVWFGSWAPTIVLSDQEQVWEALVNKGADFSSRAMSKLSKFATADWHTVLSSDLGADWDMLRRGLHSTGLNPNTIRGQTQLQEEDMSNLCHALEKEAASNNGVVKPLHHLRRLTIQLISRLCFGAGFKADDAFVNGIDDAMEENIRLASYTSMVNVFELARYIPVLNRALKEANQLKHDIHIVLCPAIESLRFSCPTHSYLHFLLSQDLSQDVVVANLFEIFLLAVDSTSFTIAWALAFLIHDQSAQKKLYDELPRETTVQVDKVRELKYLQAIVKETMRMRPIAPLAVAHKAARDSKLMGTEITAGTPVMVNLYAVLNDPNIWSEPSRFMPERFLASWAEGPIIKDIERYFLPFGAGRRTCAGMEVGKLQVAFTVASLVKKFQWSSVTEGQPPDLTEHLSFLLSMKTPLVARITPRSS